MMKMDFDKEAREALEELGFSASEAGLQMAREFVAATLRRAFLAGQESMRERAAQNIEHGFKRSVGEHYAADQRPHKADKCPHQRYSWEECESCCADATRSLPLLEEPNKEVAG